jgi:WhiB family redox-sensing transcriptional regulator
MNTCPGMSGILVFRALFRTLSQKGRSAPRNHAPQSRARSVTVRGVSLELATALMFPGDLPDIELLLTRPAWMARGACRGAGSEIFFPERGESLEPARAYCDRCPVREECASYALEISREGLLPGVWAGTSERTRRQLRRTPA